MVYVKQLHGKVNEKDWLWWHIAVAYSNLKREGTKAVKRLKEKNIDNFIKSLIEYYKRKEKEKI